ncbi:MAG: hypothetical protein AAFR35_03820 [Pseudomonadota bacterium]
MRKALLLVFFLSVSDAQAEQPISTTAEQCLSCHRTPSGAIDIVGLEALKSLPQEWPFLFEDQFDLNGDGIAGTMRFVSGENGPRIGVFGRSLAAGRFEDFAHIAGAAHGIEIAGPEVMDQLRAAFEARSPDPAFPFSTRAEQERFEARGCASCHVTETFEHEGRHYMPLSDFLLHDVGDGPRRTTPLWGCSTCLTAPGHAAISEDN